MAVQIKFKLLHGAARMPERKSLGAACYDIYTIGCAGVSYSGGQAIPLHHATTFRTGLEVEIPPGYVMLLFSRSGHAFNHDARLANCVGVIDSDYRGEIMVRLTPDRGGRVLWVKPNERIAQAMILPLPEVELIEVERTTATARGTNGLGSTGA